MSDLVSYLLTELNNLELEINVILNAKVTNNHSSEEVSELVSASFDKIAIRLNSITCTAEALVDKYKGQTVKLGEKEVEASNYVTNLISISFLKLTSLLLLMTNDDLTVNAIILSKLDCEDGVTDRQQLLIELLGKIKNG